MTGNKVGYSLIDSYSVGNMYVTRGEVGLSM